MEPPTKRRFDAKAFLTSPGMARKVVDYQRATAIFSQGDPADTVLYIQRGTVKLSVLSQTGKEAVVGMLGPGDFFGEGALAGQPVRLATATTVTASRILVVAKSQMIRVLHQQHAPQTASSRLCSPGTIVSKRTSSISCSTPVKTVGSHVAPAGAVQQAGWTATSAAKNLSRSARGNGRDDALTREFLHEQVQETRLHRLQRRRQGSPGPPERRAARHPGFRPLSSHTNRRPSGTAQS
jgi:hypothetical protein